MIVRAGSGPSGKSASSTSSSGGQFDVGSSNNERRYYLSFFSKLGCHVYLPWQSVSDYSGCATSQVLLVLDRAIDCLRHFYLLFLYFAIFFFSLTLSRQSLHNRSHVLVHSFD